MKKKLDSHITLLRFVYSLLCFSSLSLSAIFFSININSILNSHYIYFSISLIYLFLVSFIVFLILMICAFTIKAKQYDANGTIYVVYAGFTHKQLYKSDILIDEYVTFSSYVPIVLEDVKAREQIKVIISPSNRIVFKVNNELTKAK